MGSMEPDEDIERPSKKMKKFTTNEATDISRIVKYVDDASLLPWYLHTH